MLSGSDINLNELAKRIGLLENQLEGNTMMIQHLIKNMEDVSTNDIVAQINMNIRNINSRGLVAVT